MPARDPVARSQRIARISTTELKVHSYLKNTMFTLLNSESSGVCPLHVRSALHAWVSHHRQSDACGVGAAG